MLLTLYDTNDGRIVHNVSLEMLDAAFFEFIARFEIKCNFTHWVVVDVKFDETEKQWTIEELNAGCPPAVVVKAMAKYENVRPNFCKKCVHCVVDSNTNLCSNLRVITDTGRMNYGSGKITWKGEGKEYAGDMAPCDYVNEEGKCREFRRKR